MLPQCSPRDGYAAAVGVGNAAAQDGVYVHHLPGALQSVIVDRKAAEGSRATGSCAGCNGGSSSSMCAATLAVAGSPFATHMKPKLTDAAEFAVMEGGLLRTGCHPGMATAAPPTYRIRLGTEAGGAARAQITSSSKPALQRDAKPRQPHARVAGGMLLSGCAGSTEHPPATYKRPGPLRRQEGAPAAALAARLARLEPRTTEHAAGGCPHACGSAPYHLIPLQDGPRQQCCLSSSITKPLSQQVRCCAPRPSGA